MKMQWFRGSNPLWRLRIGPLALVWWADEVGRSIRRERRSFVAETRRFSVFWIIPARK